jgi:hypothetical protein
MWLLLSQTLTVTEYEQIDLLASQTLYVYVPGLLKASV